MRLSWRWPVLAVCVCLTSSCFAQTRLFVLHKGKKIGQAVASQKLMPDGSKLVQLSMQLVSPDKKTVSLRSESTYDKMGAPVRLFHESLTTNPRVRRAVTVTFNKSGAIVVEEVGGSRDTKEVPLTPNAPNKSASEFWFIRDKPKTGQADKRYRFDVSKLSWVLTTTTYLGPKSLTLGAKKYDGHHLRSDQGLAVVDAVGLPITLEMGDIRLERAP